MTYVGKHTRYKYYRITPKKVPIKSLALVKENILWRCVMVHMVKEISKPFMAEKWQSLNCTATTSLASLWFMDRSIRLACFCTFLSFYE